MFPSDKLSKSGAMSSGYTRDSKRTSDPWDDGDNCDRFKDFPPVELDENKEPTIFDPPSGVSAFTRSSFNVTPTRPTYNESLYTGNRNRSASISAPWGNYRESSDYEEEYNAGRERNYSVVEADWGPSKDDQAFYEPGSSSIFDNIGEASVADDIDWNGICGDSTQQETLDPIRAREKNNDRSVSVATEWSSYSGEEIASHYYDSKPIPNEICEAAHWSSEDN